METLIAWSRHPLARRLFALVLFIALAVLLRRLLVLLICFVVFERVLGFPAAWLARRTRWSERRSVILVALGVLGAVGVAIAFGVGRAIRTVVALRNALPDRIAAFRETPLYHDLAERLNGAENIVEGAQHYAKGAVTYLSGFGHALIYVLIGFILALIYLLEKEELTKFGRELDPGSIRGTLLRWLGHLIDAVQVTLGFQIVVAACNAVLTYPILLALRIPHAFAFMFMVFASGLVPVVGNFVAGAILSLLAYQAKGWLGVGVFVGLTFILHKVESYYLTPRLATRHVRLPGFVLIVSLILWEHLAGFAGLFISFPFLFVATRIRGEFREEDAARSATP